MKRIVIFSLLWLAGIGLSGCSEATTQTTTTGSNQATASSVVKQQTAEISFVNKTDAQPEQIPAKNGVIQRRNLFNGDNEGKF